MPTAIPTVRPHRRESLVGRSWVQAAALVALSGLFVMVLMGWMAYQSHPPIPQRVETAAGETVFTGDDIRAGQDVFLSNGLMEYGSIFGHGAYLGPDFTADYLHRSAELVRTTYGEPRPTRPTGARVTTSKSTASTLAPGRSSSPRRRPKPSPP